MMKPNVRLVRGKGAAETGGGPGGYYWHIYKGENRVGRVFINIINEPPLGQHPSIQIYLNQNAQGKGIGRWVYRLACKASGYPAIYAHMRKSNFASRKAAEHAGFKVVDNIETTQLLMKWQCD